MTTVEPLVKPSTRVIHVFDREGDIAEVFAQRQPSNPSGVLVRASHNRSLEADPHRLWEKLGAQPIQVLYELELSGTKKASSPHRQAIGAVLPGSVINAIPLGNSLLFCLCSLCP